ncbi:hypothetical protein JYT51_01360 [Candidatus Amoebophilus asiaticus]|nr:hypothetical protein [Candidatus Amoebophilus asiaticus]
MQQNENMWYWHNRHEKIRRFKNSILFGQPSKKIKCLKDAKGIANETKRDHLLTNKSKIMSKKVLKNNTEILSNIKNVSLKNLSPYKVKDGSVMPSTVLSYKNEFIVKELTLLCL